MSASLCEWCGKLHGGDCPAPVTAPPPGLHGDDDELTPLGAVVEDAARYLAMRGYLDPDADGGVPDWVLAELAEIAHEKPCGGPGCSATADGFLSPSPAADHFLQRRQQEWERWLPRWACTCGRTFKVSPEPPGTAFYAITPDGMLGDLAGHVTPDAKRRTVKHSGACPGCGRLFADTIAGRPVTPRAATPHPHCPAARSPHPPCSTVTQQAAQPDQGTPPGRRPSRANDPETPQPGNPATDSPAAAASATGPDATAPGPQPEPLPAADPYTDPGQAQADYRKAVHDYMEMGYTKAGHTLVRDLPSLPPPATSRPDALALDAAWCAASGRRSFRESFAGDAQEVADRFTALAQAASAMARNLAAERYRAPKFREALDTFTASATRLASRTQATAQNPDAWAACSQAAPPGPGRRPGPRESCGTRRRPASRWHGDRPATAGPGRRDGHGPRPRRTRRRKPGQPRCGSAAQHGPRRRTGPHARRGVRPVAQHGRHAPGERATWTTSARARARRRPPARTASRSRSADRTSPGTGW